MMFEEIKKEIIITLQNIKYEGDLSDIGNEIGIVIGKCINKDVPEYDLDSFIHGINHGISLVDGSHP